MRRPQPWAQASFHNLRSTGLQAVQHSLWDAADAHWSCCCWLLMSSPSSACMWGSGEGVSQAKPTLIIACSAHEVVVESLLLRADHHRGDRGSSWAHGGVTRARDRQGGAASGRCVRCIIAHTDHQRLGASCLGQVQFQTIPSRGGCTGCCRGSCWFREMCNALNTSNMHPQCCKSCHLHLQVQGSSTESSLPTPKCGKRASAADAHLRPIG